MKTRDELRAICDHFWDLRATETEGIANYYLQTTLWPWRPKRSAMAGQSSSPGGSGFGLKGFGFI